MAIFGEDDYECELPEETAAMLAIPERLTAAPCPFCGGTDLLGTETSHSVACGEDGCSAMGLWIKRKDWNRRPAEHKLIEALLKIYTYNVLRNADITWDEHMLRVQTVAREALEEYFK